MKALLSTAPGGPETLTFADMPAPAAGAGEVVIDVRAVGVNYPDVLIIEDKYQFKPGRPFAPGGEVAGIVHCLGEGVSGLASGDRVIGSTVSGGMAEQIAIHAGRVRKIPDAMPFDEAAAFLTTYGTSHYALKDRAALKAGESLLVLGAAGGVGLAAVEYGVELRFEAAVGGAYAEPALRAMNWDGRFLVIGFPAGIPRIPLNLTLLKSCQIVGVFWGAFTAREPARNEANIAELFALYAAGRIRPRVSAHFPLADAAQAIRHLADRKAIGKVVVTV